MPSADLARPLSIAFAVIVAILTLLFATHSASAATPASKVSVGSDYSCAVIGGAAECWGSNAYGKLGDGTNADHNYPAPVAGSALSDDARAISGRYHHTCAIDQDGVAWCWGRNAFGALGNGIAAGTDSNVPIEVTIEKDGAAVELTDIVAGAWHTCALDADGGVWCWGHGQNGERGDGMNSDSSMPIQPIGLESGVSQISSSCAIKNGAAWCWGYNAYGQVGNGTATNQTTPELVESSALGTDVVSISSGNQHSCAVNASGDAYCWGGNESGQLGDNSEDQRLEPAKVWTIDNSPKFSKIVAGTRHTCAIESSPWPGHAFCWGQNTAGSLGNGVDFGVLRPSFVTVGDNDLDEPFSAITTGFAETYHTCGIASGNLKCWGSNSQGQLGIDKAALAQTNKQRFVLHAPFVTITSPENNIEDYEPTIQLHFSVMASGDSITGDPATTCTIDGQQVTSPATASLAYGQNTFTLICTNSAGSGQDTLNITRPGIPRVSIDSPADGYETSDPALDLHYTATGAPELTCSLTHNGVTQPASEGVVPLTLTAGANAIEVSCTNGEGTRSDSISVTLNRPPTVTISSPADGLQTTDASAAIAFNVSAHPAATCTVNGAAATSPASVPLALGANTISVTCENTHGSDSSAITITRNAPPISDPGPTQIDPPATQLPTLTAAPKSVRAGRRIRIKTDCASDCTITPTLKIGKKKLRGLKTIRVKVGRRTVSIKLPGKSIKQIKKALKKNKRTKVTLTLTPRSVDGKGKSKAIRIR